MIKTVASIAINSNGSLSYEYLMNCPLDELFLIAEQFHKMSKNNGN